MADKKNTEDSQPELTLLPPPPFIDTYIDSMHKLVANFSLCDADVICTIINNYVAIVYPLTTFPGD